MCKRKYLSILVLNILKLWVFSLSQEPLNLQKTEKTRTILQFKITILQKLKQMLFNKNDKLGDL